MGITTCDSSNRGELDTGTATLKIKDLQYYDQDFYYFTYQATGSDSVVGSAYKVYLTVTGEYSKSPAWVFRSMLLIIQVCGISNCVCV